MPLIMFVSSSFNTYVNLPKKKIKPRNEVSILYRYVVDGSAINTHPPCSIVLRHKEHGYSSQAHNLMNVALFHQLINLPLKLLRLFRIASIGWSVRN